MNVRLVKRYRFEAAHQLMNVGDGHPCGRVHGHSYVVELCLAGPVDPQSGWLVDFADVDAAWKGVHDLVDHQFLNDLPGIGNTTCENLCRWIWNELFDRLPMLARVTVWETEDARCEYEGK